MSDVDPDELVRVLAVTRRVVVGEVAPRDGAEEIAAPVDRAGGPAQLTAAEWDLYLPFYGWLSEWESSEARQAGAGLTSELIASYDQELFSAARDLIGAHSDAED